MLRYRLGIIPLLVVPHSFSCVGDLTVSCQEHNPKAKGLPSYVTRAWPWPMGLQSLSRSQKQAELVRLELVPCCQLHLVGQRSRISGSHGVLVGGALVTSSVADSGYPESSGPKCLTDAASKPNSLQGATVTSTGCGKFEPLVAVSRSMRHLNDILNSEGSIGNGSPGKIQLHTLLPSIPHNPWKILGKRIKHSLEP